MSMPQPRRNLSLIFAWVFFILTSLLIIQFSLDNGSTSFSKSWHFVQLFRFLQRWIPLPVLHSIIRKLGHFIEYCLFGISTFNLSSFYLSSYKNRFLVSLLVGLFVSCGDETIQRFIATERSGQILDILLDLLGVFIGIVLLLWLHRRTKKHPAHS